MWINNLFYIKGGIISDKLPIVCSPSLLLLHHTHGKSMQVANCIKHGKLLQAQTKKIFNVRLRI